MADLTTTFMGLKLRSPLVVGASSISNYTDRIKHAEDCGAGALIIRSLFEEQIQLDRQKLANLLTQHDDAFAEASSYFPTVKHGGPSEHLMWVERARKAVAMPLFASLNAYAPGSWVHYAKQLAETGVDGLELNVYAVATDPEKPGSAVEKELFDIVEAVRAEIKLPISVKLSMFYTNTAYVVKELEKRGANAVVLFNRFLQPDIDPDTENLVNEMVYSTPAEIKIPLRWIALLYGRTSLDLAHSTGVHTARDMIKSLLAGATVVQSVATLLINGLPYLSTMLLNLQQWMDEHNYKDIPSFRGSLSQKHVDDPFAFERAQYVRLLIGQS